MVLVQKWAFFQLFLFRQYSIGKCPLGYSRNEKTLFQAKRTGRSKSLKIDIFPKGLTHGFGPKCPFFQIFVQAMQARKMSFTIFQNEETPFQAQKTTSSIFSFLGNMDQENVFYDILDQEKPFWAIKTRSSNRRKIDIFPKGLTHGFGPKMAIFPYFFFRQDRPGKCLLRYSRTKKHLSRL